MVVPLGTIGTLTVGLPGLIILLLRPDDVRRTLELHDERQRWTDGRSTRRGMAVVNCITIAGGIGWFVLVDQDYGYDDRRLYAAVPYVAAAMMSLAAAACAFIDRRPTDWAALTLVVGVIAAMTYVGVYPHPYRRYVYSDKAATVCVFVVAAAITAVLVGRELRAAAAEATARTR